MSSTTYGAVNIDRIIRIFHLFAVKIVGRAAIAMSPSWFRLPSQNMYQPGNHAGMQTLYISSKLNVFLSIQCYM